MDTNSAWLFLDRVGISRDVLLVLAVMLAGITSWFGKGYLGTKQIRKLQDQIDQLNEQRQPPAPNVNVNVNVGELQQDKPTAYDPVDGRMYFGTKHGDLPVRFHDAETIIDDINEWLLANDLKGPVSPEAVKTILRSRMKAGSGE